MTYLLILPSGASLRNFLCSRFLDLLVEDGDVIVWHALPEQSIAPFQRQWGPRVRWVALPPHQDPPLEKLLRQAKAFAQLFWQRRQGPDVQLRRLRLPLRWQTRLQERAAKAVGRLFASRGGVMALERTHLAVASRSTQFQQFESLIREARPDVIFCTFQKSLEAVPAVLAGRRLGIPTAAFVHSWDNVPKGRMPVAPDYYFVWSDHMKAELLQYYPDVTPDRIRIVGTPQFESYHEEDRIQPREEFLGELGLDPARPVVCFSGDDVLTSPYDPVYLEDLAAAVAKIPLPGRPQIVFRRCPVDWSGRYDDVLRRHPEIAVSEPLWQSYDATRWTQAVPTAEDISLLVNLVYHSDVVVNLGSTMAMDFAVYDKPGVFVAYNPASANGNWNVHDTYLLPHLRTVHELQPVYWARSAEELGDAVMRALERPEEKSSARRAWLHRHVMQPMEDASRRIFLELRQLAEQGGWKETS